MRRTEGRKKRFRKESSPSPGQTFSREETGRNAVTDRRAGMKRGIPSQAWVGAGPEEGPCGGSSWGVFRRREKFSEWTGWPVFSLSAGLPPLAEAWRQHLAFTDFL